MISKSETLLWNTYQTLLILLALSFPFQLRISSLITVGLVINWIFLISREKLLRSLKTFGFWAFLSLFLMVLMSVTYSQNKNFFLIEKKLSLLVFPVMFSSLRYCINKSFVNRILWSFVGSCTVASIYSLTLALSKPGPFGVNMDGITEMTQEAIGISHVYFGLYLSFCLVILFFFLLTKRYNAWLIFFSVSLGTYLLFFMYTSGAKMATISLLIVAFSTSLVIVLKKKKWKLGLAILALPCIVFVFTLVSIKDAKSRFQHMLNPENYYAGDNSWNSLGVRVSIFKCVKEVTSSSLLLGTGIGDVQDDLNNCYRANGFNSLNDMNAHNEYLQILLGTGVLGLLIYLGSIVYILSESIKLKAYMLSYFLVLFSLCSFTEALLERQQGVMFFSYFTALLYFYVKSIPRSTTTINLKSNVV